MFVNYFHFNTLWFYYLSAEKDKCVFRPYESFEGTEFPADMGEYKLLSDEKLTERQARNMLSEMFPNDILSKCIMGHSGPRSKGCSGSRPKKSYNRRGNYVRDSEKEIY